MTQPIRSGAPVPVQGVTGGPGLNSGNASIDSGTGNIILTPPGNAVEIKKAPSAFNVYEYFNSNADNVRLTMLTATGGPEFIGVQATPTSVARNLVIGTTAQIQFAPGNASQWVMDGAANFYPQVSLGTSSVGNATHIINQIFGSLISFGGSGTLIAAGNQTAAPNAGAVNGLDWVISVGAAQWRIRLYQ